VGLGESSWQLGKNLGVGDNRAVILEEKLQTLLAAIWSQSGFLARTPVVGAKIASLEVCESWHTPGVTRGNWKCEYGRRNMISLPWIIWGQFHAFFWVWVMLLYYLKLATLHSFPTHFVWVRNSDHHKAEKYFWKYQNAQNFPPAWPHATLQEWPEGRTEPWNSTWLEGCAPQLHTGMGPFPQDLTTTMCLAAYKSLPLTVRCLWPGFLT